MDLGLHDRVAIVGGASEGIGRATAKMLAMEGCRVVMAARREDALGTRSHHDSDVAAQHGGHRAATTDANVRHVLAR